MVAVSLEPKFLMHQYELAQTYYDMGKKAEAKVWAKKVMEGSSTNEDDIKAKKESEILLGKL
jgi:hypothetical protein